MDQLGVDLLLLGGGLSGFLNRLLAKLGVADCLIDLSFLCLGGYLLGGSFFGLGLSASCLLLWHLKQSQEI